MFKILATTIIAITLVSSFALAQSACGQRDSMLTRLAKKYGEVPVAIGVTNNGDLVEVLTTGDGGTWTMILSNPNGTSCLVAAGEGWRTKDHDDTKLAPVI